MARSNTVYGPVDTYNFPVPQDWPAGVAWAKRRGFGTHHPAEAIEVHRIDADDCAVAEAPDSVGVLEDAFLWRGQIIATVTDSGNGIALTQRNQIRLGLGNLRRIRLHPDDRSVRELCGEVVIGLQILGVTLQPGTNQLISEIGDSRLLIGDKLGLVVEYGAKNPNGLRSCVADYPCRP